MSFARNAILFLAFLVCSLFCLGSANAKEMLPPALSSYMSASEYKAGHPVQRGQSYHHSGHIDNVRIMAFTSALARGLSKKDARLMDQIAIVHDWDPARPTGSKPRVPATLEALAADFSGAKPLVPGHSESLLKSKFGWGVRELQIATAIIQRTEYPFDGKHPNAAYGKQTPLERYKNQLKKMSTSDARLTLSEGAMFAEYADKASFYARAKFSTSFQALVGLSREENKTNSKPGAKKFTSVRGMAQFTPTFMATIGSTEAFGADRNLAKELRLSISFPTRESFFASMPSEWGRNFEATRAAFQRVSKALAEGLTIKEASKLGTARYEAGLRKSRPTRFKRIRLKTGARFRRNTKLSSNKLKTRQPKRIRRSR